MEQLTARVPEDMAAEIDDLADESDRSKSDVLRELLRKGLDADAMRAENTELRNRLQAMESRQRDTGELVEFVEEQRSLQREQAMRDRLRSEAGVFTRAKWWLTGMPKNESED